MIRSLTQDDTPGVGNCFIEALADQTRYVILYILYSISYIFFILYFFISRYDPVHSAVAFTHQDLRYDVVHYVTDMVQLGVFSPSIESIHQPFQRQSIVNYAIVH